MTARPDGLIDIRMSMLPGYSNCSRMAAVKQWPELFEQKGFELRKLYASAGAAIGTGFHAAAAYTLTKQQEGGALKAAVEEFDKEVTKYGGVQWDPTTGSRDEAIATIERMLKIWLPTTKDMEPLDVEDYMEVNLGDGFVGTGHRDLRVNLIKQNRQNVLIDHKTGSSYPSPQVQLGGYVLLSNHKGKPVEHAAMDYIKRVTGSQTQPAPIREFFDIGDATRAAWSVMKAIKRDVKEFVETGDIEVFLANPQTMLCSRKYCPAFGTSACTLGRDKPKVA